MVFAAIFGDRNIKDLVKDLRFFMIINVLDIEIVNLL